MKVKNNSARPYFIGDVVIVPDATETVGDEWAPALVGMIDLEVVEAVEKKASVGRPAKVVEPVEVKPSETTKAE